VSLAFALDEIDEPLVTVLACGLVALVEPGPGGLTLLNLGDAVGLLGGVEFRLDRVVCRGRDQRRESGTAHEKEKRTNHGQAPAEPVVVVGKKVAGTVTLGTCM